MTQRRFSLRMAWAFLVLPIFGLMAQPVLAAAATTPTPPTNSIGQALEIAPPVVYLNVSPGQTASTQIYLRNVSGGDLIVDGQANDFVAAGEDGTPKILLNADPQNPYSMASWVSPPTSLLLIPREIKTMNITLHIPANASPGGHYGAIRFTATPPALKNTGVSLSTSIGSLMLITVSGNIKENMTVNEFSVNKKGQTGSFFESGPLNFVVKTKNNGNVHEQPSGQIQITDMFSKKVATLNINVPPKNVLPLSIRKFEAPLDKTVIGNKKLFGHYRAVLNLKYGDNNSQNLTASLTFWIIPWRLIIVLLIILVGGFFLLRFFIKRYNRHIIDRSNKARRSH